MLAIIIDESYTAFVMERHIVDRVFIANETINWLKKKNKKGLMFKLDFQSAQNYVTTRGYQLAYTELKECSLVFAQLIYQEAKRISWYI